MLKYKSCHSDSVYCQWRCWSLSYWQLSSRWRHQMETFSALPAFYEWNPPVSGGFHSQRPVTRSLDVFFDVRLNKPLGKQSRRRWLDTPLRPLWRLCNDSIKPRSWLSPSCSVYDKYILWYQPILYNCQPEPGCHSVCRCPGTWWWKTPINIMLTARLK